MANRNYNRWRNTPDFEAIDEAAYDAGYEVGFDSRGHLFARTNNAMMPKINITMISDADADGNAIKTCNAILQFPDINTRDYEWSDQTISIMGKWLKAGTLVTEILRAGFPMEMILPQYED